MQAENTTQLLPFIEASKAKGASDESLTSLLTRRGWPADDVYPALAVYWERMTGLPVPGRRRARGESARDGFLYLLSFATLAAWACALGSMLFTFIDYWFPDAVAGYPFASMRKQVTWQMASIAVAFPIYLVVMRSILREAQEDPQRLQSGVRKWLTYIALLLTSVTMIGDLVFFLDTFLTGELTVRFVLKSLCVLAISGAIFLYYLRSLRWNGTTAIAQAKRRSGLLGALATALVVGAFLVGFGVAGTPGAQRRIEADGRRVDDLKAVASAIYAWHQRAAYDPAAGALPKSLSELVDKGVGPAQIKDPETGAVYAYRTRSDGNYEVCATFAGAEENYRSYQTNFWHHGKGETCFVLNPSQQPLW